MKDCKQAIKTEKILINKVNKKFKLDARCKSNNQVMKKAGGALKVKNGVKLLS